MSNFKHSQMIESRVMLNRDKFESYHVEDEGHWVYCKAPYFSPDSECGTIHEYTVSEMLDKMSRVEKGVFNGHSWEAQS